MKAKCPHCLGDGCEKCEDGFIEIGFAKGDLYIRRCLNEECGFENGGRIGSVEGWPLRPCICCGSDTEWKLVGRMK